MTKKNEIPALVLALGTTLLLLGGGFWWLTRHTELGRNLSQSLPEITPSADPAAPNSPGQSALEQRFSTGERLLITGVTSAQKEAGISAIASGDFAQAVSSLEASLQQNRNDPEALIYLNNARIGNGQSYTLAVAVPTTTSVDPAQEILRGVAQAQRQVNEAGGINGVPLRIVIANDDNAPTVAAQVAESLVQDPTVLGVVGHFGSETSLAAGEVYQQGGLVMVSPTSTAVGLSGFGDAVFRTVPSDRFTATTLSRYLVNSLQQRNAAIYFNADSDYSRSLKDELTTALLSDGGQVVAEINVAQPSFNASNSLDQVTQQGAEVLVLATNTATLDQALQVVQANQNRLPLLGGDSLYNPQLLQRGGDNAADMVVTVPWILLSNPNTPFVATARQLWGGGDVNWRTAMAYDAVLALAAGLAPNPSRSGLQATLSGSGFTTEGATGTIRFLPSGDRNQAMQLVQVRPGTRSGYGYDFVPVQP
ncbi:ABC transporter substrate-binding protein [Pseudanabaena sp. FACHB-2040]|uniref:ABC transporter substrate-binding protein n=1 Tax=Pseudanabaena sp. FACHB-2040 TaxID=2692859 RepID=UPI0016865A71|nr:ABC transporter substrate-binding protein [Pseudanabaena sp. FACHB-2040]MBD2259605.1 ABC transporter substrate-binding protein [Pseudanabaena sp. FACHB-2040]